MAGSTHSVANRRAARRLHPARILVANPAAIRVTAAIINHMTSRVLFGGHGGFTPAEIDHIQRQQADRQQRAARGEFEVTTTRPKTRPRQQWTSADIEVLRRALIQAMR